MQTPWRQPPRQSVALLGAALGLLCSGEALAQSVVGAAYLGGRATGSPQGEAAQAAGDLLELPRAAGLATLQLIPTFDSGPFALVGEFWLEGTTAEDATPARVAEVQQLRATWAPADDWLLGTGIDLINAGTAYNWNPSNPFGDPRINNLDRAFPYHREGDPFASIERFGQTNNLALLAADWQPTDPLYGPDIDRVTTVALRWDRVFRSSDLTLTLAWRDEERFGSLAGSTTIGERLVLYGEAAVHDRRRTLLPVTVTLPLPSGGQTLYRFERADEDATVGSTIVGGQYTFANLTNVIIEYFHNGEGYSGAEFRNLRRDLSASAEGLTDPLLGPALQGFNADAVQLSGRMRRNYLFGRVAWSRLAQSLDLHLFLRWGLDDGAQVAGMLAEWPLGNNLALRASAEFFDGPDGSEVALIPFRWTSALALWYRF